MTILKDRCARLRDLYNPMVIHKTFADVKTVNDCLALQVAGEPCLKTIERQSEGSKKQLLAMIRLNIIALNNFLHLKNQLNEAEVDLIADEIVDEFGGALTFADIHYVLKKGKTGAYGQFYERLSAPTVCDWFRQYYNARLDAAEHYSQQLSKADKATGLNLLQAMKDDDDIRDNIKKIIGHRPHVSKEDADAEYQSYKKELMIRCIKAKPADERTPNENKLLQEQSPSNQVEAIAI